MMATSDAGERRLRQLARELRSDFGGRVWVHHGGGSFKSRMKKADRSGAHVLVLLGDDELAAGQLVIKPLRGQGEQLTVDQSEWLAPLKPLIN